jgi:hypothetical protein
MLRNDKKPRLAPIIPRCCDTQTENDDIVNDRVTGKHGNPERKEKA